MKRSTEKEMMDLPGNPKALLVEDLRNLRIINRYLGGYRGVIKGLKRLVGEGRMRRFSLLDVGTGSADIPKVIVQWARNRGIEATVVALEPEPVTARVAAMLTQQETNPPFIPLLQKLPSAVIPAEAGIQVRMRDIFGGAGFRWSGVTEWRRRFAQLRLISFLHRKCCIIFPRKKSLRCSEPGLDWRGRRSW